MDLRLRRRNPRKVLFHYTSSVAFANTTHLSTHAHEVFASLKDPSVFDDIEEADIGFGEGVYATEFEPMTWSMLTLT